MPKMYNGNLILLLVIVVEMGFLNVKITVKVHHIVFNGKKLQHIKKRLGDVLFFLMGTSQTVAVHLKETYLNDLAEYTEQSSPGRWEDQKTETERCAIKYDHIERTDRAAAEREGRRTENKEMKTKDRKASPQ